MAINTVKATINGQEYTLTYNGSSGKYEATINAPSTSSYNNNANHYYPVTVVATDDANNSTSVDDTDVTLGNSLKLTVKERVKPTVTITYPTDGSAISSSTPTITAQLRDADSGIDPSTLTFNFDGGANIAYNAVGMTLTPVAGGYDLSYVVQSALTDANHTVNIGITDHDGNVSNAVASSFALDTTPPNLVISAPEEGFVTKNTTLDVTGNTNDVSSNPCTVTITVNGTDQGTVTVDGGGNFTKNVPLTEGANTIIITSTDTATRSFSVTRHVTRDTVAPTITLIELVPNPVDAGQTYVIKVTCSD